MLFQEGPADQVFVAPANYTQIYAHSQASGNGRRQTRLSQILDTPWPDRRSGVLPDTVKDLDAVYAQVLAQIRAQYTVGYLSTNERADGAWRKVQVKVKRRDLRVRSRSGFFAPLRK